MTRVNASPHVHIAINFPTRDKPIDPVGSERTAIFSRIIQSCFRMIKGHLPEATPSVRSHDAKPKNRVVRHKVVALYQTSYTVLLIDDITAGQGISRIISSLSFVQVSKLVIQRCGYAVVRVSRKAQQSKSYERQRFLERICRSRL